MNSEVNNILTLSSVTPVKTDNGTNNNSNSHSPGTQAVQPNQVGTGQPVPSAASLKKAAEQSSKLLQAVNLSVEYGVDSSTKEVIIKVMDNDTGKLVRQIPSAEMLDFVKRLQELEAKQTGAVFQTRA